MRIFKLSFIFILVTIKGQLHLQNEHLDSDGHGWVKQLLASFIS